MYPGPIGAVLAPALDGVPKMGELAKASTLCGLCREVCPVDIPIPDMLLKLRSEDERNRTSEWTWFGLAARSNLLWKAGLKLLPMVEPPRGWKEFREFPRKRVDFRRWWRGRP